MSIVIDFALVAVVLFCAWRGWRSGLIRGVCGVLALILSLYGANLLASTFSHEFTGALHPFVSGIVDSAVTSVLTPDEEDENEPIAEDKKSDVFTVAFTSLRRIGLAESAATQMSGEIVDETDAVGRDMTTRLVDKLCSALAYVAVFLLAFLLLSIVFALIGNLLNFVFAIPGIELIDSLLGMVLGVAKGAIILLAVATALRYIGVIPAEMVEDTVILEFIINRNPVARILGV